MLGALAGLIYLSQSAYHELGIARDRIQTLANLVIVTAIVGGKLLFYLEDPAYYFSEPQRMWHNFGTGFVFYGSLLFSVPVAAWYFYRQRWPVWPLLDRIAITTCIIHAFGRGGCFLAGCCYGLPSQGPFTITFSHSLAAAKPLHTPLHPTQLYEISLILPFWWCCFSSSAGSPLPGSCFGFM